MHPSCMEKNPKNKWLKNDFFYMGSWLPTVTDSICATTSPLPAWCNQGTAATAHTIWGGFACLSAVFKAEWGLVMQSVCRILPRTSLCLAYAFELRTGMTLATPLQCAICTLFCTGQSTLLWRCAQTAPYTVPSAGWSWRYTWKTPCWVIVLNILPVSSKQQRRDFSRWRLYPE